MTKRKRVRARPTEAKEVIMGFALLTTGIFEFLEGMESGDGIYHSATRAVRRTKVRGKAIKKAAKAAKVELDALETADRDDDEADD